MSILAHNINISLLAIKARNQSYKIRNLEFYLATGNDGHWAVSSLLSCHIRYLGDAYRYFYDEAIKIKK